MHSLWAMLDVPLDTATATINGRAQEPPSTRSNRTSNGQQNLTMISSNGHTPITISVTSHREEYLSRPSRESVLQRLSEALMRRSLTKIDLSQRGLQPSDARLVKMALSQNANLAALKLGYNNLGDHGVATLAAGISVHKSLVLLDLGFNNFGDYGATALAKAMRDAAQKYSGGTLETLYLAGNLIGEDGALALADFIRHGSSLRKLYVTGNRIGADGVKAITEAIVEDELSRSDNGGHDMPPHADEVVSAVNPAYDVIAALASPLSINPPILPASSSRLLSHNNSTSTFKGMQELFFGGTGMCTLGCQAVSRLLEKSSCLRVISLPNCDIGDEEVALLAASVKANKVRLPVESIQLSFNNMTHKGLEALTNALWGSTTLKELKLDNNAIGDRGAHQVAAILPAMSALETLDVGFNSIKSTGLNVLMKAAAEAHQLLSLSVSGNDIDVPAAKAVAYALAYNLSLQSIFLVHCNINHEGQRHITAGIVSNSRTSIRKLTGFDVGPVVVTLGFPEALKHWTNEQVLNFINMMWDDPDKENPGEDLESDFDPLHFLPDPDRAAMPSATRGRQGPLEASVVVDVAKKAYENLVANGVDVFSRRKDVDPADPSFASPLADDAIMIESSTSNGSDHVIITRLEHRNGDTTTQWGEHLPTNNVRSFVAPPDAANTQNKRQEMPDPARKQRIVEWLCTNIKHLNALSQVPFSSRELWRLHQHYFTPVVNECGGIIPPTCGPGSRIVSSVPEVSRGNPGGSAVTPSTQSSEDHLFSVPVSDPVLPGSPGAPTSLPLLKRKVSFRFLGDAMVSPHAHSGRFEFRLEKNRQNGSVAKMIEEGHTGHSLPPKSKKARRNLTRISFLPRIKAKLDSYLDVCHEKALITMRQLYFVEQAILGGQVNPLNDNNDDADDNANNAAPNSTRTHLSGTLASEAEMIVVDMI